MGKEIKRMKNEVVDLLQHQQRTGYHLTSLAASIKTSLKLMSKIAQTCKRNETTQLLRLLRKTKNQTHHCAFEYFTTTGS